METQKTQDTSTPQEIEALNTWTGGYTQLPNTILRAANLDSDSKVALGLLYGAYTYARDNNQLQPDGSFYYTNEQFGEHMAISGDQVARKVIPDLIDKSLICTIKRNVNGKTRNYYILLFTTINNWDGTKMNPDIEARKTAHAKKANDGRRRKEARIMLLYGGDIMELVQQPLSICDREQMFEDIAAKIAETNKYTIQTAKNLINKMLQQYKEAQTNPSTKPEWLKRQEEIANTDPDEIPY